MSLEESISVVTPIYEDAEASGRLFIELANEFDRKIYIVAIDDGSVRQPVDVATIRAAQLSGVVIKLKRNVGHQRAIAVGLNYVAEHLEESKNVVVMDSDGEDSPASIRDLIKPLESENVDLVVAQRKGRVETIWFRALYIVYKWLFVLLVGRKINFGNFMALKSEAIKRLVTMEELWLHVASCVLTSKLRIATCPINRVERYAGIGKTNLVGQALHGFRAIMVFAEDVLVRVGIACALVAILAVFSGAVAVLLKILGFATPGWFSVALGILFLVFLQTGALTLMTLMLTGVVKSGAVSTHDYKEFIDTVEHT